MPMNEAILKYVPAGKKTGIKDAYRDGEGYHIVLNDGWTSYDGKKVIMEKGVRELRREIGKIHEVTDNPLIRVRRQKGISQTELAEKTGIPVKTLQKYEQGVTTLENVAVKNIWKIAQALDVSMENLVNLH